MRKRQLLLLDISKDLVRGSAAEQDHRKAKQDSPKARSLPDSALNSSIRVKASVLPVKRRCERRIPRPTTRTPPDGDTVLLRRGCERGNAPMLTSSLCIRTVSPSFAPRTNLCERGESVSSRLPTSDSTIAQLARFRTSHASMVKQQAGTAKLRNARLAHIRRHARHVQPFTRERK